ncbi:hypothetical protein MWU59_12170 [Flavobacteriaceae bacterium F08102]|nr:hypothetical protein [Flavobacteriaceae bacterium F08102]
MKKEKKTILYISTNDGSDTRINKEIKTLAPYASILFVGIGEVSEKSFIKEHCEVFKLIPGNGRSLKSRIKHLFITLWFLVKYRINSIHVINEQTYIFFYPFIFHKYIVLDLFDSIFLSYNKSGNDLAWFKRIVYAPVNKVIVTDHNRKKLLPDFLINSKRVVVLENYPNQIQTLPTKDISRNSDDIVILYSGTLMKIRGSETLLNLVNAYPNFKILAAGWVKDDISRELLAHPKVTYLGIIKQEELLKITSKKCDYIYSFYEPISVQNINASPNKIYDGIMCKTPIIINKEVVLSSEIDKLNIGVVVDSYYNVNLDKLTRELVNKRNTFTFTEELIQQHCWNFIEHRLLLAHQVGENTLKKN